MNISNMPRVAFLWLLNLTFAANRTKQTDSHTADTRACVLFDILQERERQNKLKAEGRFDHTCADRECTDLERICILVEEVGEVSTAMQNNDTDNLREELVQVCAVCLAWLEYIEDAA